jgi:hypothetical protein
MLIALMPSLLLAIQTSLLDKQNTKIDQQNILIETQNKYLVQQTYLQEANRRSSLVFLFSNVMDAIDRELKDEQKNPNRNLSSQLMGRIISLSRSLKPYRYLLNDTLTKPISPERSQLLINLINSNLGDSTYQRIFDNGDFSHLELRDLWVYGIPFGRVDFSYSIFDNVNFDNCSFSQSKFNHIFSKYTNFAYCTFFDMIMRKSYFDHINFSFCFFNGAIELENSLVGDFRVKTSFSRAVVVKNSFVKSMNFKNSYCTYFHHYLDQKSTSEKIKNLIPSPWNLFSKELHKEGLVYQNNSIHFDNTFLVNLYTDKNLFNPLLHRNSELNFFRLYLETWEDCYFIQDYVEVHKMKINEEAILSFTMIDTLMTPQKILDHMKNFSSGTSKIHNTAMYENVIEHSKEVLEKEQLKYIQNAKEYINLD